MFDLNSLLTVREKIYMQDSELGSQVPLISSDGPRHGILPLEYGMRGRQLSASTCNSASEYSSLWFSFSPLLSFLLFLSEPDILKGLGFYSVLFCYFFSSKKKRKNDLILNILFLFFYSVNPELFWANGNDYSKGWKSGKVWIGKEEWLCLLIYWMHSCC